MAVDESTYGKPFLPAKDVLGVLKRYWLGFITTDMKTKLVKERLKVPTKRL